MGKSENWCEKYLNSDHHSDRLAWTKIHYERITGVDYPEPFSRQQLARECWHHKTIPPIIKDSVYIPPLVMARGRWGYDVTIKKRAQSVPVGDFLDPPSRYGHSSYISRAAFDDMDSLASASKKHDQHLLDNITNRLCKLEYDCVKPGTDVAIKTGFRRFIYGRKPFVERETREQRRKDELLYPWDYTANNIFRPPMDKSPWAKKNENIKPPIRSNWDTIPDSEPDNHYPDCWPYKERVTRQRVDTDDTILPVKLYENMETQEVIPRTRGLLESEPERSRQDDGLMDLLLEGINQPLPKSFVAGQYFCTGLGYDDPTDPAEYEPNPNITRKIKDSKKYLQDFDNLLDEKFKRRKKYFSDRLPPRPFVQCDETEVTPSFTHPVTVQRTSTSIPSRTHLSRTVRDIMGSSDSDEFEFPPFPKHKYSSSGAGRFSGRHHFSEEKRRARSVPPETRSTKRQSSKDDLIGFGSPLLMSVGPTPEQRKLGEYKQHLQRQFFTHDFSREASPPPRKHARHCHSSFHESRYSAPSFKSHRRAASEPPPIFWPYHHSSAGYRTRSGHYPSSDLAVRQAKATLGRIERDLGWGEDLEDPYTTPISHVPQGARMRTTVYTDEEPSYSYKAPPSPAPVRVRPHVPYYSSCYRPRSASVCYGSPASSYGSTTSSYHGLGSSATPSHSRRAELELKMAMASADDGGRPYDLGRLRTLHTDAKDKMDRYKVSLDRYLPVDMGPVNDVPVEVEYKYDELKHRMPSLEPYLPGGGGTRSSYVAPYTPASSHNKVHAGVGDGRPPVWKPTVSDTRKRVRDVLCKAKKDPHYYDY